MQNSFQHYAASCRILYSLYYASPNSDWLDEIAASRAVDFWPRTDTELAITREKINNSLANDSNEEILQDYRKLFQGLGTMSAYPWGSVYTDRDGLLMGETTQTFRSFCLEQGIQFNLPSEQPWDHIGLQLDVLATLLEDNNINAIRTLLGKHVMTWVPTFLSHVNHSATTDFYNGFAELTQSLLNHLVNIFDIEIMRVPIYASIPSDIGQSAS